MKRRESHHKSMGVLNSDRYWRFATGAYASADYRVRRTYRARFPRARLRRTIGHPDHRTQFSTPI